LINRTELSKDWDNIFDYHIIADSDEAVLTIEKEISKLDEISLKKLEKSKNLKLKKEKESSVESITSSETTILHHHSDQGKKRKKERKKSQKYTFVLHL